MSYKPKWLKAKGYVHITPSLNLHKNWKKYLHQIKSSKYISMYAFYPLIYREIKQRRYKKIKDNLDRTHSYRDPKTGRVKETAKIRPIHYASHFDSLIYGYYAEELKKRHEAILKREPELDKAVLAYRSIPVSDKDFSGKSNIHFAHEVFEEIREQVEKEEEVAVLALDLDSFFSSLSHRHLYNCWASILGKEKLPKDHNNVFNACTNFSYILYDDLRKENSSSFDESKLAEIRRKHGFKCFFESNADFRNAIKEGKLPIYKNPFRRTKDDGNKEIIGIPQGLPISSVLSNIYLLDFDRNIIKDICKNQKVIYRRYSDDIIIICPPNQINAIYAYIKEKVKTYSVSINDDKTKRFLFKKVVYNKKGEKRLTSIYIDDNKCIIGRPLTYLGFEYRGYNTMIKSSNLSRYYRRLIYIIKSRAKRANRLSKEAPTVPRAVYLNQIKKLYNAPKRYNKQKDSKQIFRSRYNLEINDRGEFEFNHFIDERRQGNYLSYIQRCDEVFETKDFSKQLRKKKKIIGQAIRRHLIDKGK